MQRNYPIKICAAVLSAVLLTASTAFAEETITCSSIHDRYQYCSVHTENQVQLVRKLSSGDNCRQGRNWGYDRHGVWVDGGCRAEFRVGHYSGHSGHGGGSTDKDAATAVGAVAGIALIAALASRNKRHEHEDVASWAVGTFTGYDEEERTSVELTILPGGSVKGFAGGHDFTGSLEGSRLQAGRQQFDIRRSGSGFDATDERDPRHRVTFRRSGGGY